MHLDKYSKYLRFRYLKQRLYKRELETAFYTKKERGYSGILSGDVQKSAVEFFRALHNSFSEGLTKFNSELPDEVPAIIQRANDIVIGEYEFFEGKKFQTGGRIQWNRDYINEYEFPQKMGWRIDPHSVSVKAEAYLPIMLGRLYQLPALGAAWYLTQDGQYASMFKDIYSSFVLENPTGAGIQWYKSSEAAIRLVNIVYGTALIFPAVHGDEEFLLSVCKSLIAHLEFIEHNADLSPFRDHHTFLSAFALFLGGSVFAASPYGMKLRTDGMRVLEQEARLQILNDGVCYLQSMHAQILIAETLTLALWLAKRLNAAFTAEFSQRAASMFGYLSACAQNTRCLPNLGDAMPGSLLCIEGADAFSHAVHILRFSGFAESGYIAPPSVWLYIHGVAGGETKPAHSQPSRSRRFPDGGHLLLQNDSVRIFVKSAAHGKAGRGAPGHSDIFSFEYFFEGLPVIVDPGTNAFYHDPVMRNMLRSELYHNTVYIDNSHLLEYEGSKSRTYDISKPQIIRWQSDNAEDIAEMQHFGYLRLPDPVVCKRIFKFDKFHSVLAVQDTMLGGAEHILCSALHLHPDVSVHKEDSSVILLQARGKTFRLRFLTEGQNVELSLRDSWYSSRYYHLLPSKKIHFRAQVVLPFTYSFTLEAL